MLSVLSLVPWDGPNMARVSSNAIRPTQWMDLKNLANFSDCRDYSVGRIGWH